MDRTATIERLREDLIKLIGDRLTPLAGRYGYAATPLEDTVKWRPLVLVIGNYSSGKSTLINELLGGEVQATGQAPTDDCFTIITHADGDGSGPVRTVEERDGSVLLGDPAYPFGALKPHGQRFAAHFRLKKVTSPFLRSLAIIDTPGMLDSVTERDRGYDYQAVVGDLAQIADLVLVLFDAHKAGTLREAHVSLRDTLPHRTFEDRVLFVLNRVDECASLNDLLRVYGTLCWNLSQMLGRKDIPPIRLTWSAGHGPIPEYLRHLTNQREEIRSHIESAPGYRLDHLASFVEMHGERLAHLTEALLAYGRSRRTARLRSLVWGAGAALVSGLLAGAWLATGGGLGASGSAAWAGAGVALGIGLLWGGVGVPAALRLHHSDTLRRLDDLTPLSVQGRRDSWAAVRESVRGVLSRHPGGLPQRQLRQDHDQAQAAATTDVRQVRAALGELTARRPG